MALAGIWQQHLLLLLLQVVPSMTIPTGGTWWRIHPGSAYQHPYASSSSYAVVANHGQYYPSPPTTTTTSPQGHYQDQIMNQHVQHQQGGVQLPVSVPVPVPVPPTTAYHCNGINDNGTHTPFPNTHTPYQPEGPSSLHVSKLLPNTNTNTNANEDSMMVVHTININLLLETLGLGCAICREDMQGRN